MMSDTDIPEYLKDSKMVNLRISYFAGGIINMYQDWFNGNLDCSLNDIALEVSMYTLNMKIVKVEEPQKVEESQV